MSQQSRQKWWAQLRAKSGKRKKGFRSVKTQKIEGRIIEMRALGATNPQIAADLKIKIGLLEWHISRLIKDGRLKSKQPLGWNLVHSRSGTNHATEGESSVTTEPSDPNLPDREHANETSDARAA